jgi:hypothetical protein
MADRPDPFDKILLNETVYIYRKSGNRFYPKNGIEQIFRNVKNEKSEDGVRVLHSFINRNGVSFNQKEYRISGTIIRYTAPATFITEYVTDWYEIKLGYLFLIDFKDYLFIVKRNVAGLAELLTSLEPLPYITISKMLYDAQSLLESYGMNNMDISSSAMKTRNVVADNLVESFNYVGANNYVLNFLRIHNKNNDRYAISINSSKLSKSGEKSLLPRLIDSCGALAHLAEHFVDKATPLDVFAKPYDYAAEREHLAPVSVTILFMRLIEDIEKGNIQEFVYEYNGKRRVLDLKKQITGLSQYMELEPEDRQTYTWKTRGDAPSYFKDMIVKLNPKSIRLSSIRLRQIKVIGQYIHMGTIVDYINNRNNFFVAFEECDFRYYERSLFRDSLLLGAIDQFLDYFQPDPSLSSVTSEKGSFSPNSISFDTNSSFHHAEAKFSQAEFLVLDDLGGEWADHIIIHEKQIIFVHSKAKNSIFSATAFTDIIGQAQKNMGALHATESMIRSKSIFWGRNYRLENTVTNIPRLRRGSTVNDFVDRYISLTKDVNVRRKVCLNLNFISKQLLETNLRNLQTGANFGQKREAIQILWQISSLISSCYEHGAGLEIWCKP